MTSKEFAEKYAGKKCKCSNGLCGVVVGYNIKYNYVIVENNNGLPLTLSRYNYILSRSVFTHNPKNDCSSYYVSEITIVDDSQLSLPINSGFTTQKKVVNDWPHKCPSCNSPAVILGVLVDCSSNSCKHKYKSKSALDLFRF